MQRKCTPIECSAASDGAIGMRVSVSWQAILILHQGTRRFLTACGPACWRNSGKPFLDQTGCARQGGYSDRQITRTDGSELDEGEIYAIDNLLDELLDELWESQYGG